MRRLGTAVAASQWPGDVCVVAEYRRVSPAILESLAEAVGQGVVVGEEHRFVLEVGIRLVRHICKCVEVRLAEVDDVLTVNNIIFQCRTSSPNFSRIGIRRRSIA